MHETRSMLYRLRHLKRALTSLGGDLGDMPGIDAALVATGLAVVLNEVDALVAKYAARVDDEAPTVVHAVEVCVEKAGAPMHWRAVHETVRRVRPAFTLGHCAGTLHRLVRQGKLVRTGRGWYAAAEVPDGV